MFLEDINVEERIKHLLKTPRSKLWEELQANLDIAIAATPDPPKEATLLLQLLQVKRLNPVNYFKLVDMWPSCHHRGLTYISEALSIHDISFLQEARLMMKAIPAALAKH